MVGIRVTPREPGFSCWLYYSRSCCFLRARSPRMNAYSRRGSKSRFPTPSLYDLFCNSLARKMRRMAQWSSSARRRRMLKFEALEPRVLLSADLSFAATAAADLTLRVSNIGGAETLQLIETHSPSVIVAAQLLEDIDGSSGAGARI